MHAYVNIFVAVILYICLFVNNSYTIDKSRYYYEDEIIIPLKGGREYHLYLDTVTYTNKRFSLLHKIDIDDTMEELNFLVKDTLRCGVAGERYNVICMLIDLFDAYRDSYIFLESVYLLDHLKQNPYILQNFDSIPEAPFNNYFLDGIGDIFFDGTTNGTYFQQSIINRGYKKELGMILSNSWQGSAYGVVYLTNTPVTEDTALYRDGYFCVDIRRSWDNTNLINIGNYESISLDRVICKNNMVSFFAPAGEAFNLKILNAQGKTFYSKNKTASYGEAVNLNISEYCFGSGMYFIQINSGKGAFGKKFFLVR